MRLRPVDASTPLTIAAQLSDMQAIHEQSNATSQFWRKLGGERALHRGIEVEAEREASLTSYWVRT